MKRYLLSCGKRFWDARFLLLLWVVLEAIFAPSDPREITFSLSQRVAFFLGNDRKKLSKYLKWPRRFTLGVHI
jgi:hypothetical protein